MAVQQMQEQETTDTLHETYELLDQAAEAAYEEVAADVEQFFADEVGRGYDTLDHGRIDVTVRDGEPVSQYRGRFYTGSDDESSTNHRYVPRGDRDWDGYVDDVYAPIAAAAGLAQSLDQDGAGEAEQRALDEINSYLTTADPDAETAQTVFDALYTWNEKEDDRTVSSRIVY